MKIELSKYLETSPLNESRILRFDHDRAAHVVVIVYEYAADAISRAFQGIPGDGISDYRKLQLNGVIRVDTRSFQRDAPDAAFARLQESIAKRPISVIASEVEPTNGHQLLKLEISDCFDIAIEFGDAGIEVMRAKFVPDGHGGLKYSDVETGEVVDSQHPFD